MRSSRLILLSLAVAFIACAKTQPEPELPSQSTGSRSYFMGFSIIPPKPDVKVAIKAAEVWTKRSDAAMMHVDVPWSLMLGGVSAAEALKKDGVDLEHYYRAKHLRLVLTIDVTNGLARDSEATALVKAHRSITEPSIQQLYRNYVRAVVETLHPDYLGLAAETNLIRAIASRTVYNAVVKMTNDAAADVRRLPGGKTLPLYVSVQVETAWGKLPQKPSYVGVDQDLRDFPFINALGLSSYPYLGGFKSPSEIPLNYYARVKGTRALPVMVVEGGWPSKPVNGVFSTSPELQAAYVKRQAQLLDEAKAIGLFQLTFADLDLSSFPRPVPTILPLFATLGVVDTDLKPKPALHAWDEIFSSRITR